MSARRALITGNTGFVGGHLAAYLGSRGYDVTGFAQANGPDVRDASAVAAFVEHAKPDVVVHLAAAARSANAESLHSVNVLGTIAVLEAASQQPEPPLVLLVSSSAVYGETDDVATINEQSPTAPVTLYGASKLAQEVVAAAYSRSSRVPVVTARTFNLLGPGLPHDLACGRFAASIAAMEADGIEPTLRTGNLNGIRDFTDVRDAVRAFAELIQLGRPGDVYNVCSGRPTSLRECVDILVGLSTRTIVVEAEPSPTSTDDVRRQVGDPRRLQETTQWRPSLPLERSLADMLQFERQRAAT